MIATSTKALERRIRQHVIGKEQRFWATTAPGLEPVLAHELSQLPEVTVHPERIAGGVEFSGRITACYQANLFSAVANRVMMRLFSFRASSFGRLCAKVADLPWELYLYLYQPFEVHVTTAKSRLYHSSAVKERFEREISKRLAQLGNIGLYENAIQPPLRIYARLVQDHCEVSLDSSGPLLYKRGVKSQGGKAPLRETVAAALLQRCRYKTGDILVDPMCGTGTFALEASLMARRIPPGWFRSFAFNTWPAFKPATWNYIRQQAEQRSVDLPETVVYASDIDADAVTALLTRVREMGWEKMIQVTQADFLDRPSPAENASPGVIVLNPPYGRRLKVDGQTVDWYRQVGRKLKSDFNGWRVGMILPSQKMLRVIGIKGKGIRFLHGGSWRWLFVGRVG